MADGIAIVADGTATFVMTDVIVIMEMEKPFCDSWCFHCGRWNSYFCMADVIATVVDGITMCFW